MQDMYLKLIEFIQKVIDLLVAVSGVINNTADMLNEVEFIGGIFHEYLGYIRFVFGAPLWIMFTTVLLIPLGVTVYIYTLKGIGYIKNLNFFT
jgi:hypothetical protein